MLALGRRRMPTHTLPRRSTGRAVALLACAALMGARSETKPVWRISLFTNLNLLLVVCASFGFQIWSHHNGILARFLKTSPIPLTECLIMVALGTIPLLVLELLKVVRNARRETEPHP